MTTNSENDVKMWNMLCHLTGIIGFVGPLIVWLIKKNEIPSVDVHGKDSLNFQITVLILLFGLSVAASILTFILIGFLLYPVIGLLWLAAMGLSVYAAIQANNGVAFKYPLNFNLIK
jgi:uncharacterized protein